ncbi:LPXTG cell wall anchor domain-containing protein, partial [uncultured Parolsenella sp.]|uniref:LPXTG cell wall anchor domain-containing protein n=1 Tax=uncultured Parolsenella sp. TaxID=2083008 RepID=UPI0027D97CAA
YDFSQPVKGDLKLYAGWVSANDDTPEQPKPEADNKADDKANKQLPQTGDTTNYAIPVALGVAGVVAVGGALVMRKRQQ